MLARWITFALVSIQVIALGIMTKQWGMPIFLAGIALAGVWGKIRFDPKRDRRVLVGLGLTVPFVAWWIFYLEEQRIGTTILQANIGILGAHYLLGLQVLQFFFRHENSMPPLFPLGGVFALTLVGDVFLIAEPELKTAYFVLALGFAALSAVYFSVTHPHLPIRANRGRGLRELWLCGTLLLAFGLAWSTARFIEFIKDPVDQWAANLILQTPEFTLGSTNVTRLGSIPKFKREQGNKIALRIVADNTPGYLRTRVLEEYVASEWRFRAEQRRVNPLPATPPGLPELAPGPYFPVVPPEGGEVSSFRSFEIHPDKEIRTAMHTPYGTAWIAAEMSQILVDPFGVSEGVGDLEGTRYDVHVPRHLAPTRLSEAERMLFTQLPENLHPDILARARDVCSGKETDLEKIAAVVQYFTQRYHYSLDIRPPYTQDPMEYFLLGEPAPAAHCEYFASGAALFLRAVCVPCRYVLGVMAWERSTLGGYWIARNRDAHAWVEAFVSKDGMGEGDGQWIVVEATPAEGIPESEEVARGNPLGDFLDALRFRATQMAALLKNGEWAAGLREALVLAALPMRWLLTTWTGWIVLAAIAWPVWKYAKARGWLRGRHGRMRANPRHAELARLLRTADARLKRHGMVRGAGETLHAFATRVETDAPTELRFLGEWYRAYAACRYGAPITTDAVAELATALRPYPLG